MVCRDHGGQGRQEWGGADLKVGQYRKERGGRSEVRPLHLGVANVEILPQNSRDVAEVALPGRRREKQIPRSLKDAARDDI